MVLRIWTRTVAFPPPTRPSCNESPSVRGQTRTVAVHDVLPYRRAFVPTDQPLGSALGSRPSAGLTPRLDGGHPMRVCARSDAHRLVLRPLNPSVWTLDPQSAEQQRGTPVCAFHEATVRDRTRTVPLL